MTPGMLALAVLLQEEHAAGPVSPFEVNFGLVVWTWVVFGALFFTLKKWAWPPILRATEARERRIQQQIAEAERANAEARAALEEHKKLLASAKDQAHTLLNDAKVLAQREREALLAKARKEQEQMLERAKREIETERDRAVTELRREAVDLSLAAAAKLIEAKLDDEANRRLVAEFLASLEKR